MCVRMYVRVYDCRTTQERRTRTTGDTAGDTAGTRTPEDERKPPEHDHRKRQEHGQRWKPAYIGKIANNEKKSKKLKKIWKCEKPAVSL